MRGEYIDQENIVILDGTSSSGKTVIAKALQGILDGYYIHTRLDHFLERVRDRFNLVAEGTNPSAVDGLCGSLRVAINPFPMI